MSTEHTKVEVSEALCSALYQITFSDFIGETEPQRGARKAFFHVGTHPKDLRVTVIRDDDPGVRVRVEWRNYAGDPRNPLKCEQTLTVAVTDMIRDKYYGPVEQAMLRVLAIYQDVVAETGVAGLLSEREDES
ncbi:MAG: hypothetical protein ACRDQA_02420 [Nocardioidaceae bacterium]